MWCHPGLQNTIASLIGADRREHTDRALSEQLRLEEEGYPAAVEPGHAAVYYTNPTTGGDIVPAIRAEFHRLRPGVSTAMRRDVETRVFQVFEGRGTVVMSGTTHALEKGDIFVILS